MIVKTDAVASTGGPPLVDTTSAGEADTVLRVTDVSVSLGGRRVLDRVDVYKRQKRDVATNLGERAVGEQARNVIHRERS